MPKFTGKLRYRIHKRLFRVDLIVLQYEIIEKVLALPGSRSLETEEITWWADVKPEWIMTTKPAETSTTN